MPSSLRLWALALEAHFQGKILGVVLGASPHSRKLKVCTVTGGGVKIPMGSPSFIGTILLPKINFASVYIS